MNDTLTSNSPKRTRGRPRTRPAAPPRTQPARQMIGPLTQRQVACLLGLRDGLRPEAIAAQMGITKRTVDWHLGVAYRALGVEHALAAIAEAERQQLLPSRQFAGILNAMNRPCFATETERAAA